MFVYGLNDYTKRQMTLEHILPCISYSLHKTNWHYHSENRKHENLKDPRHDATAFLRVKCTQLLSLSLSLSTHACACTERNQS